MLRETVAGRGSYDMTDVSFAEALIDSGHVAEAADHFGRAYAWIHERSVPDCFLVGVADSVQGKLLARQGKPDEAEPLLIAGLENLRRSRGDHHLLTRQARDRLVSSIAPRGAMRRLIAMRGCWIPPKPPTRQMRR